MTASEKILQKALVASNIDSRQWNSIQAGLRDRAFFSSRVAQANILDALRKRTAEYSDGHTSISEIRKRMRQDLETMHYTPEAGTEGTIKDLYSKARLDVIIKQNVASARGFIRWAEGNEPGAYAAFPAQEFKRVHPRKHGRPDWPERWAKAGGKFYGGRMIALKDDPVWTNLSIFGTPYPPFDWGSGMGVRDIDRKTAIELKLIEDAGIREKVKKLEEKRDRGETPSMNGNLEATIPMRDDSPIAQEMRKLFEDDDFFKCNGNVVKWQPELMRDLFDGKIKKVALGIGYTGEKTSISKTIIQDHISKHIGENEMHGKSIPLERGDFELIPSLWRSPSNSYVGHSGNDVAELDTLDGHALVLVTRKGHGPLTIYKYLKNEISREPQGAMHAVSQ